MSDRQMSLDEARRASANIIKTLPAEVYNAKAPNRFLKNVAKFNEAATAHLRAARNMGRKGGKSRRRGKGGKKTRGRRR